MSDLLAHPPARLHICQRRIVILIVSTSRAQQVVKGLGLRIHHGCERIHQMAAKVGIVAVGGVIEASYMSLSATAGLLSPLSSRTS